MSEPTRLDYQAAEAVVSDLWKMKPRDTVHRIAKMLFGFYQPDRDRSQEVSRMMGDAFMSHVANQCLEAGVPAKEIPPETPFNEMVRKLVVKKTERLTAELSAARQEIERLKQ